LSFRGLDRDTPISHSGAADVAAAGYRRRMALWFPTALVLSPCVLLLSGVIAHVHADPVAPRVRPLGPRMASLVERGYAGSPTLARLVDALNNSDVIVHVEERRWVHAHTIGETRLVAHAGGQRYLRISIDMRLSDERAIALLGHELQHAWEIAQARWVVDPATMVRLYMQIGHVTTRGARTAEADTPAAVGAAAVVRAELRADDRVRLPLAK
jgi:hypothetical protein